MLSALAAGIAWWLAAVLSGDPRPVFAAVTAIVALSPGVANPRLQIVDFVVGVGTGLLVGELARPLIGIDPGFMVVPVGFVAIVAASSFGRNPMTLIQAGASAVLVVGSAAAYAGRVQFVDALIGGLVAAAFSQVFFAPDPVPLVVRAMRSLAHAAERIGSTAPGVRRPIWEEAEGAAAEFEQALAVARGVRRWTLRGRLGAARIEAAEARWLVPGRRLASAAALACLSDDAHTLRQLDIAAAAVHDLLEERAVSVHTKSTVR